MLHVQNMKEMNMLSKVQLRMLNDCADSEPTDYGDFFLRSGSSALGWRNRERVIDALKRKGLLDEDLKPTAAAQVYLAVP
jgi:hypothetical protein